MALVAYDNSDSSEYEEDAEIKVTEIIKRNEAPEAESVTDDPRSIFNLLPKPSHLKKEVLEEDDEFLQKKEYPIDVKPKSKITIPSLKDFKDVEHTIPTSKSRVPNGKKSGLLSILPEPKNAVRITTKSLIPNVIAQKPTTTAKKKAPLPLFSTKTTKAEVKSALFTDYSDESDSEEVQNDFFSINKPVNLPIDDLPLEVEEKTDVTSKEPRTLESYFKKEVDNVEQKSDYVEPSNSADYYSLDVGAQMDNGVVENANNEMVLDEEAILKLCGTRGKRKREEIQIVDVNQQEVLSDAREWLLKGLMDDTSKRQSASKRHGNEPTSQQRRKHQITYLAHQAKANEAELQNQWANNRMTKRQTQSKYGF